VSFGPILRLADATYIVSRVHRSAQVRNTRSPGIQGRAAKNDHDARRDRASVKENAKGDGLPDLDEDLRPCSKRARRRVRAVARQLNAWQTDPGTRVLDETFKADRDGVAVPPSQLSLAFGQVRPRGVIANGTLRKAYGPIRPEGSAGSDAGRLRRALPCRRDASLVSSCPRRGRHQHSVSLFVSQVSAPDVRDRRVKPGDDDCESLSQRLIRSRRRNRIQHADS